MNMIYQKQKKYADQERVLEQAIAKYPVSLDFLYNLVNVHIATNNMEKLIGAIDRILAVDPNNDKVLPIKARILERQGKNVEALDIYKRLYALHPESFELMTGVARANFNCATEIVNNGATIANDTEYALVRQRASGYLSATIHYGTVSAAAYRYKQQQNPMLWTVVSVPNSTLPRSADKDTTLSVDSWRLQYTDCYPVPLQPS